MSDDEIRARLQTAIARLEDFARSTRKLDLLNVLAAIGMAEHEIEAAKMAARASLHQRRP